MAARCSSSVVSALLAVCCLGAAPEVRGAELSEGFRDPPLSARPAVYWAWINGLTDQAQMTRELEELKAKGIGGLYIFDVGAQDPQKIVPAGPAFMGPESLAAIGHTVREATRLGLEVGLVTSSSWNCGGPWIPPEYASMGLYHGETAVTGPRHFSGPLPDPTLPKKTPRDAQGRPAFAEDVAVLAVPSGKGPDGKPVIEDLDAIVDLTGHIDPDGRLDWDVPPGAWKIMRFVCANTGLALVLPSPNSGGLAIDHFNPEATRYHFEYLLDKLHQELGDFQGTALKQMYVCSYELSGSTWTPGFLTEFRKRRGYDMTRYLPVLAGATMKDKTTGERFVYDYRKTLGDLLVDAFYRTATELSNKHGLRLCAEAGGPGPPLHQVPVDALKAQGAIDIPRGEFWKDHDVWVVKETACASHIYGKGIVDMESFTSWRHWQDGPFELKPLADRALCDGTNHFTLHTAAHNPSATVRPGWVYHAGTHAGVNTAWWPKAKPWLDYLSRCSYLLQQGLFVADVCYYYGDQGFNFVPPKHIDPALGYGYDYDVTNPEVLLSRMSVKNGRLTLPDGLGYELLVLPEREDMDPAVIEKIEQLVQAGATVVGPRPARSNGLGDYRRRDGEVRKVADRLWGPCDGTTCKENTYGKGRIVWGTSLRDLLQARGLGPDFGFVCDDKECDLDYIHRRTAVVDIYFVINKREQWQQVTCSFRVSGKTPQLWLPDTGERKACPSYEQTAGVTRLPLELAPFGSVFVVFRNVAQPPSAGITPEGGGATCGDSSEVKGPWQVFFPPGWGAPASKMFPQLISWTQDSDEGVKYFSGAATYRKTLNLAPEQLGTGKRLVLDLGRVRFVAEVYLNGRSLGTVWKPPFTVDITDAVRAGPNELVVEVANTWSNRLAGDARSEGRDYCRTNIAKSLTWTVPWKDTPLLDSGLLGPVRLIAVLK
jgi:hypothetical protein